MDGTGGCDLPPALAGPPGRTDKSEANRGSHTSHRPASWHSVLAAAALGVVITLVILILRAGVASPVGTE